MIASDCRYNPMVPSQGSHPFDALLRPLHGYAERAGLNVFEQAERMAADPNILPERIQQIVSKGMNGNNLVLFLDQMEELFTAQDPEVSDKFLTALYEVAQKGLGAIAHHAARVETTIRNEQGAKASDLLPKVFQSLVIVKEEGLPTRRRPLLSDFPLEMTKLTDALVIGRLLRTEGEGQNATVSLSHEKLFDAWPSLRDYVAANKKQLTDQTLLESRAQKWAEMGKPWFSGLAAGREYQDFQRAKLTATPEMNDYLKASRQAVWFWRSVTGLAIFLIGVTVWLWQKGYSLDQALLKVQSIVVSIHIMPEMVAVPAGTFQQGDIHGVGESYEQPVRKVAINAFFMGKYEVTFEEYDRFAIAAGRRLPEDESWGRARRPVINVSWDDAVAYTKWLSNARGKRYRLPTESEWEYVARSGGSDEIWAGTSDPEQLAEYAVFAINSRSRTAVNGEKKPNGLGLHDMTGNVWEWVEDCVHEDYKNAPMDGSAWLAGDGGNCGQRVFRGGSWGDRPAALRTSFRGWNDAGYGGQRRRWLSSRPRPSLTL